MPLGFGALSGTEEDNTSGADNPDIPPMDTSGSAGTPIENVVASVLGAVTPSPAAPAAPDMPDIPDPFAVTPTAAPPDDAPPPAVTPPLPPDAPPATHSGSVAPVAQPPHTSQPQPAAKGKPKTVSKPQAMLDAEAALALAAQALGLGSLDENELTLMIGQGMGESMFGRAITGYGSDMAGTNNVGSVQSTASWEKSHAKQDYFGKFAHTDSHSDGTHYVGWYRIYPNQFEGWKGYLNTVLYGGPSALASALAGGPSGFANYLKSHGYYEAPVATYTSMLSSCQADVRNQLSLAKSQGLKAADPTKAGYAETTIAPVTSRIISALRTMVTGDGIVWFGKPQVPGGGGGSAAVIGLLVAVAGGAAWGLYRLLSKGA